jgi:hypothetical protein
MQIEFDPGKDRKTLKRGETRRIISMRKANDREQARYAQKLE